MRTRFVGLILVLLCLSMGLAAAAGDPLVGLRKPTLAKSGTTLVHHRRVTLDFRPMGLDVATLLSTLTHGQKSLAGWQRQL